MKKSNIIIIIQVWQGFENDPLILNCPLKNPQAVILKRFYKISNIFEAAFRWDFLLQRLCVSGEPFWDFCLFELTFLF